MVAVVRVMASVPSVVKFAPEQLKHTRLMPGCGVFSLLTMESGPSEIPETMFETLGAAFQELNEAVTTLRRSVCVPVIFPGGSVGFRFHWGVPGHMSINGVPPPLGAVKSFRYENAGLASIRATTPKTIGTAIARRLVLRFIAAPPSGSGFQAVPLSWPIRGSPKPHPFPPAPLKLQERRSTRRPGRCW